MLASRSPRRIDLLTAAGFDIVCRPSDVDELTEIDGHPFQLAIANAEAKAFSVAATNQDSVVLGADTIVVLDGAILGKPRDMDHALEMLERLSGRIHEVITGVSILNMAAKAMVRFHDVTRVRFNSLTREQLLDYAKSIDPLDKAGAYAAQDDGGRIIDCVEGSFSNVVGLPMERTLEALNAHFIP